MNAEFLDESDSSDEDYVPGGPGTGEVPSEVDSDGDPEDPLSATEDTADPKNTKRKRLTKMKQRTNGVEKQAAPEDSLTREKKQLSIEEKKKKADDIWASFKNKTAFKKKEPDTPSQTETIEKPTLLQSPKSKTKEDTVTVKQIFEFAGEVIEVEKEVKADSIEARLSQSSSSEATSSFSSETTSSGPSLSLYTGPPKRKAGLGGIGSVLNQIGKKQKLSTLEKSQLDWNKYKKQESIEDELESYKKGKDGYLDKQDFLQRADVRTFEIEREIRTIERNKRMNNNPPP